MKHLPLTDAVIVLLWAAVTTVAFIVRGDDFLPWGLFVFGGPLLGQLYNQRRSRRRYAARNQFECRVRLPALASRPRWVRALATPYPDRWTLQLLSGGATAGGDPVVVRPSDATGLRKARFSEFLFRFSPTWHVAAFASGRELVLLAAPATFLAVLAGPASSNRPRHTPRRPEGRA